MSRNILASDLTTVSTTDNFESEYESLAASLRPALKGFVNSLLFQDQIVVPFADFTTVLVLMKTFGERNIVGLLECGSLKFFRYQGNVCFVSPKGYRKGGTLGITGLPEFQIDGLPRSQYADVEKAIDLAIRSIESWRINPKLRKRVLDNTTIFDLKHKMNQIQETTKSDLLSMNGNTYETTEAKEIARLAAFNRDLEIARQASCIDFSISDDIQNILKHKVDLVSTNGAREAAATTILTQISGMLDVGELVINRSLDFDSLLKIRNSRSGAQFRNWFNSLDLQKMQVDSNYVNKQFYELIDPSEEMKNHIVFRVLRFLAISYFTSKVDLNIGVAASVIDTFFLDKIIRGPSAKFFVENLKEISNT